MTAPYHPSVLWAQRKEKLFVTIDVQDCKNPKLKLDKATEGDENTSLKFTGVVGESTQVDVSLDLYGTVDKDDVKVSVTGRHVLVIIPKTTEDFWPRLTNGKQPRYVKVDWSKWVDEDEEDGAPEFDMSSLGNLGGMEQFDSDDDDDEINPGGIESGPTMDTPTPGEPINLGDNDDDEEEGKTNGTTTEKE